MLLILFNGHTEPAVAIAAAMITEPAAGHGYIVDRPASSGEWRLALELGDPFSGEAFSWHDITQFYAGDSYQRGADEYLGRYRAAVAQVQLQTDDDMLAPWGQDTSSLFGSSILLDGGLLMRLGMFRVVSGVVVEWNPLWTGRVETWGDASAARGQIRTHVVTVTDTIADLANLPTIIDDGAGVSFEDFLSNYANWLFGVDSYGDTDIIIPFDLNPVNAINRMDQGADPFGYVWRSRRTGRAITYPAPWDTTNVARWSNPLLDSYPAGLVFSYSPDFTDIEYIADDDAQQFGVQRTSLGVLNSFIVTTPSTQFLEDDPLSEAHYGVRPYVTSWVAEGVEQVVIDLLNARAFSSAQALPLRTTLDHEGFWSALAVVDHLDPVTVIHATSDDGLVVTAPGTIRNVTEDRTVRGVDDAGVRLLTWQSTVQVDITSTTAAPALLPVEDLAFVSADSPLLGGPSSAQFTWTNPTQPDITPTEVQLRVIGRSLIWFPKSYPGVGADGVNIGFLSAATTYTLQVRLVRRVAGVVVAFSAIRQVTFTTPAIIVPIIIPGTDPGDTNIGIPPDFGCDTEWHIEENDGTGWTVFQSGTQADLVLGGDGLYHLPADIANTDFDPAKTYRVCYRVDCGDGFGPWICGASTTIPDDWTDPCTEPPELSVAPYDDPTLVVYVPKVCAPDIIEEAVSGLVAVHGDALSGLLQMLAQPDRFALQAISDPDWSDTAFGIVAYGECPQINGVTGDKTISVFTAIVNNDACVLFECAGMQLTCAPGSGSNWVAGFSIVTVDGVLSLASGDIPTGPDGVNLTATFDASTGDCFLYVDGVSTGSDSFGGATTTVVVLPIWRVGVPPDSWITDCAIWSSVLAAPPFDPTQLTGLALWLDASDTATITASSGHVSQWDDKSGNGRDVGQSNGSFRPTTGTRTQNGHNVIDNDGAAGQFLESAGAFWYSLGSSTAFVVFKSDGLVGIPGATSTVICEDNSPAGTVQHYEFRFTSTQSNFVYRPNNNVVQFDLHDADVEDGNPHLVTLTDTGSVAGLSVDGGSATTASYTRSTISVNRFQVGAFVPSGNSLDGWIAEIIIYNSVLSSGDITLVENYLTDKWGL